MPLIGTGNHKFPEDVVLRVMREETEKFSFVYPQGTLRNVKIVRYDKGNRRITTQTQATNGKFTIGYHENILFRPSWSRKCIAKFDKLRNIPSTEILFGVN